MPRRSPCPHAKLARAGWPLVICAGYEAGEQWRPAACREGPGVALEVEHDWAYWDMVVLGCTSERARSALVRKTNNRQNFSFGLLLESAVGRAISPIRPGRVPHILGFKRTATAGSSAELGASARRPVFRLGTRPCGSINREDGKQLYRTAPPAGSTAFISLLPGLQQ